MASGWTYFPKGCFQSVLTKLDQMGGPAARSTLFSPAGDAAGELSVGLFSSPILLGARILALGTLPNARDLSLTWNLLFVGCFLIYCLF